jgi:hypothetical protein
LGIILLEEVRSERTSPKEMIPEYSYGKSCLSLLIHLVAAPSSYSSLANCLLQMSYSQNYPNSPCIKYLASGHVHIGIDTIPCRFTLFSLFFILLFYPKLTHPNVALVLIMIIVSYEITRPMDKKTGFSVSLAQPILPDPPNLGLFPIPSKISISAEARLLLQSLICVCVCVSVCVCVQR